MRKEKEIRKILFATDFSTYSEKAREYVSLLARSLGSEVTLMHSMQPIPFLDPAEPELSRWYARMRKELQKKMEKEVELFQDQNVVVRGDLRVGTPWQVILEAAQTEGFDMVVIGSHGIETHEGQVMLGTTSHKLALSLAIPVLLVRG